MTRILSTQTLKALRTSSLTTPKQVTDPSPRVRPTDTFEAPKKTASLRDDADGFDAPVDGVVQLAQSVMGRKAHDLKLANDTDLGAVMHYTGSSTTTPNTTTSTTEADGVVTPELTARLGEEPTVKREEPTSTGSDLEALALKKNGPEFVQQVKDMAGRLGVAADWVFAVMKNESGMSPTARNPNGGATGLIQFMPSTARDLGTTTAALRTMSAVEQLKYVEKYYAPFKGRISSGTDLYLATFYPVAVGKPDGFALGGSKVAHANPIFDLDRNGQITAGEFRQYYRSRFPELA